MQNHRWMSGAFVFTLALVAMLFVGCGGGGGGGGTSSFAPPSVPLETSAVIGSAGGEILVDEGDLTGTKLMVPAGALANDETIRISKGTRVTTAPEHKLVGPAVTVQPHGLTFSGGGTTLRIPYNASALPPGTSMESLAVLKKEADGTVYRLEAVGMPAGGGFLEVEVASLSSFQAVLTTVDATGTWVAGAVAGDFDPSQFDFENFNLEDFDFENFDPSEFNPGDFDFSSFDFSNFDLNNLGNLDFSEFDLSALGDLLAGLPINMIEISQNTDAGTFTVDLNETDANGDPVVLEGTFAGPRYSASASYPVDGGTETTEVEFELYSDNFGVGTVTTTLGNAVTIENLGLVRAESLIEEPTYGPGLSRLALTISASSDPSDDTLPTTSLSDGNYSGTFVQLAADETTGLVIATFLLDSDTGNPFLGTVSGSEYILFRQRDLGDGANLIETLQLTRTSKSSFVPGILGENSFSWIYSDGAEGVNFGTGSARIGN